MESNWLIVEILGLVGYLLFRLGMLGFNPVREFIGGALLLGSFVVVFVEHKFKGLGIQILVFWILITPIVEMVLTKKRKK